MSVAVFTKAGSKSQTKPTLPKSIFGIKVTNHELLRSAYLAAQGNARVNLARTKTRGEIRGGGKKPWAQKGTGRARFGSSRNPIWRGGGIVFGPRGVENYTHKLSKSARKTALIQALSLAMAGGNIIILEDFECKTGKVKPTIELIRKMDLAEKKILLVVALNDDLVRRATRNLKNIDTVAASNLSTRDVLDAESIILTKDAMPILEKRLGEQS